MKTKHPSKLCALDLGTETHACNPSYSRAGDWLFCLLVKDIIGFQMENFLMSYHVMEKVILLSPLGHYSHNEDTPL